MANIKLLINAGTAFSASSPFHYTLCWDNQYAHTGHCKEHQYLRGLEEGREMCIDPTMTSGQYSDKRINRLLSGKSNKPTILNADSPYVKNLWTQDEINEFFHSELHIDKYIRYYRKHWENIKYDYQSVADFSNQNGLLTKEFLLKIKDQILEYFDVKVTIIARDPVNRAFSQYNRYVKKNPNDSIDFIDWDTFPNYSKIYKTHASVWGKDNVRLVVMEELDNPVTQKQELSHLSNFLGYDIVKVHENVYYPNMRSNFPKHKNLQDQYTDTHDIDQIMYDLCVQKRKDIYNEFQKTFGYIPTEWGNYETNLAVDKRRI